MQHEAPQLDEMVTDSVHRYEGIGFTERFVTEAGGGLRSEQTGRATRSVSSRGSRAAIRSTPGRAAYPSAARAPASSCSTA